MKRNGDYFLKKSFWRSLSLQKSIKSEYCFIYKNPQTGLLYNNIPDTITYSYTMTYNGTLKVVSW